MTAEEKPSQHYHYQLPTRMNVEDKLINIGPFSLTLRQGFVLTLGGCVAVNIWRWLDVLSPLGEVGLILRIALICIPLVLALVVAVIRVADRSLEEWAMVLVRYYGLPKLYRWRHLPASLRKMHAPQEYKQRKRKKERVFQVDEEGEVQ